MVRNDPGAMLSISGTDDAEDEVLYVMTRAAGEVEIKSPSKMKLMLSRRWNNHWRILPEAQLGRFT